MQLSAHTRSKGFVLLITVTLLAFLVLLLVSLASLTRVETQVASNNQQLSQARQNALMALNIAIGQLQKYVGPDQRTTARSDMDATLAATSTKSGRWTGVYGNGVSVGGFGNPDKYGEDPSTIQTNLSSYYTANAADPYAMKGSQARLLNWLVSGNESATFTAATNGQITTAGTGITFAPTDAVALGSSTALALDIKVKNLTARLLVGPNSVIDPSDYVAAPLVPISAVAPGLGATPVTIGNYAWWVGDEGSKARINLPLDTTATNKPRAFVSAQRAAVELMDGTHPVGSTTDAAADLMGYNSAYDPAQANLPKVLNTAQLPIMTPASASALTKAVKYRFHDLTGYSTSVLSDTYTGGLKKDLSAILATGATSPLDTDFIFQPLPNNGSEVNEFGLPTWGQLRSFARTTDTNGSGTAGLTPTLPVLTKISSSARPIMSSSGIAPILTYAALGFRYVAPLGDVDGNPIRLAIYPIFVLWNPYTTDMKPSQYEVGIERPWYSWVQLSGQATPVAPAVISSWTIANVLETRDLSFGKTSQVADPYFRFIINNPGGIPAGQSLVFTLQSSGGDYVPGSTPQLVNDNYSPTNYVLLPSTGLTIGTAPVPHAGGTYRVGVNRDGVRTGQGSTTVAVTYFPAHSNGTASGDQNDYQWGGNGSQQTYLAPANIPTLTFTGGNTTPSPYTSANVSRQWYQFTSWLDQTSYNYSPYGTNVGFPSDATAGNVNLTGPESGKIKGLLQPATTLQPGGAPSWRIHVKATFPGTRWMTMTNPRAFMVTNTTLTGSSNFTGSSYITTQFPPINVFGTTNPTANSIAGLYNNPAPANATPAALYEVRSGTQPLLSIGQLQHANLGWLPSSPAYSIGNSLGTSIFDLHDDVNSLPVFPAAPDHVAQLTSAYPKYANTQYTAVYDQSWLLNRALWDKYFVSTVPNKGTGTDADTTSVTATTPVPDVLPNPRHLRYNIDPAAPAATTAGLLRNADTAAAHLMLAGGFNVNSTSEQAWRAILGGTNKLGYDPTGNNTGGSAYAGPVYSRFTKPDTNATNSIWKGYRQLTEAQIAQLAKTIVSEIRSRGPFVSLGDFINHRLYDNGTFPQANDKRLKGTIQQALDLNAVDTTPGLVPINNKTTSTEFTTLPAQGEYEQHALAYAFHPFSTGSAPSAGSATPTAPYSSRGAGAPQYLTQADILSTIGGGLSARSDTFVIRTYGEAIDAVNSPATGTPIITGRAWCEAVVQRLPDYVDPLITPETNVEFVNPGSNAALKSARTTNLTFGRKFKIISFRWLAPTDI